MNDTVAAILDNNVIIRTVCRVLVHPRPFTALEYDGIIVDRHITSMYKHIRAIVYVDGIAAGCLHTRCWSIDIHIKHLHTLTAVDMVSPEPGINGADTADRDILAMGYVE